VNYKLIQVVYKISVTKGSNPYVESRGIYRVWERYQYLIWYELTSASNPQHIAHNYLFTE
jgi:hypothetical protein